ncbi:MAG: ComEC/Rec2 family competence protein, partial [Paramuribaculum sp.]|nr:ComEC/Rec2 family competence protein [Paramuribaculum sp.]
PSPTLHGYFSGLRGELKRFILRSPFGSELKELLVAVLLGDTSLIPDCSRQAFSEVGLSHIIAISGLHIAIITMLLLLALWPMQRLGAGRWRPIPIMLILWGYACLTGFSPSVTRAVIMASVYIVGRLTERRSSPYNSLCLAALLILIFRPDDLFSAGFQLSFAAVLSILLFANDLNPVNPRRRILYNAVGYVTVSIAAVIGTFTISILYFHIFSFTFLPANLICALLFPLLFGCSIICLLLHAVGIDVPMVYHISEWIFNLIQTSIDLLLTYGPRAAAGIYISVWCLIPAALAIASLKVWLNTRKLIWGATMTAFILSALLVISLTAEPRLSPRVYAARHGFRTDLVVDGADGVLRILTTLPNEPVAVAHDAAVRYRDFIGRQRIDSIEVITDRVGDYGSFAVNHQIISFPAFSMAIVPSAPLHTAKVDYAVICRGFKSSVEEVMDCYRPDTIILARDLHPRTSSRLGSECAERGVPYISLRERSWSRAL